MVFSSPEVMTVCLAVQETELLVLDGWKKDTLGSEFSETGIPVCMLTEQPSDQGIYKYQSARDICKALLGVLQKERSVSSQPSGCLAVFSPLGRCGKTALARALLQADTDTVVIFGKSWTFQVTQIIKTTLEENLSMIKTSLCLSVKKTLRLL